MKWNEKWELDTIPEDILKSEWARRNNSKRKTRGAGTGRPRSNAPRCACGKYTLHTAKVRNHKC